ncbi:hypothetical protein COLO4_29751 [Corchorus olitorius]|uniref:Uncharacterized protein n=1 Tax=Corchorus olitorius TaxID=93759 RepID=A0A1R3HDJ4_9ROSI|nr:hypothetical protein COLO4_29751 [Corchorus olitorius]
MEGLYVNKIFLISVFQILSFYLVELMVEKLDDLELMTVVKAENPKRKHCDGLPPAKGNYAKKGRRTFYEPRQKEERIEELLKKKSVVEGKIEDMQNGNDIMIRPSKVLEYYLNFNICRFLPPRSDIQKRHKKIKEIDEESKKVAMVTDEMLRKMGLEDDGKEIQMSRRKINWNFPWFFIRKTATNGTSTDQGEESWHSLGPESKYNVVELEKKVFTNNKKKVKLSDFEGLEEALLEAPRGEIPKYLQIIASKITKACGITEPKNVNQNILILICAAVYEMEQYVGISVLNWEKLVTWGATYNKAKDSGFQLMFLEKHLKNILYGYLGFNADREEMVQKLEAEMKDIMSATKFFDGTRLSHGLFPE